MMKDLLKKLLLSASIILFLVVSIWQASSWKTSIEKDNISILGDIGEIRQDIENIRKEIKEIEKNTPPKGANIVPPKDSQGNSPGILGIVGLIDEELAQEGISSYGVRYHTDFNVCEINEAFEWNEFGKIPYLGNFIEVENTQNHLRTWCMVIGSFNDNNHPNRVLLVSEKVADNIVFQKLKGILAVSIRLLNENEWNVNKDCVHLYRSVYKLEKQ